MSKTLNYDKSLIERANDICAMLPDSCLQLTYSKGKLIHIHIESDYDVLPYIGKAFDEQPEI